MRLGHEVTHTFVTRSTHHQCADSLCALRDNLLFFVKPDGVYLLDTVSSAAFKVIARLSSYSIDCCELDDGSIVVAAGSGSGYSVALIRQGAVVASESLECSMINMVRFVSQSGSYLLNVAFNSRRVGLQQLEIIVGDAPLIQLRPINAPIQTLDRCNGICYANNVLMTVTDQCHWAAYRCNDLGVLVGDAEDQMVDFSGFFAENQSDPQYVSHWNGVWAVCVESADGGVLLARSLDVREGCMRLSLDHAPKALKFNQFGLLCVVSRQTIRVYDCRNLEENLTDGSLVPFVNLEVPGLEPRDISGLAWFEERLLVCDVLGLYEFRVRGIPPLRVLAASAVNPEMLPDDWETRFPSDLVEMIRPTRRRAIQFQGIEPTRGGNLADYFDEDFDMEEDEDEDDDDGEFILVDGNYHFDSVESIDSEEIE